MKISERLYRGYFEKLNKRETMRKKNGVVLYDGGLIVLLVLVCVLAFVAVGRRMTEVENEGKH